MEIQLMRETIIKIDDIREFESEEYESTRPYFDNGIVDDGYFRLNFDFSECSFRNENMEPEPQPEYNYCDFDDEEFEEIIEEID